MIEEKEKSSSDLFNIVIEKNVGRVKNKKKFSFPRMKSPLFHVLEEDENGAFLQYK